MFIKVPFPWDFDVGLADHFCEIFNGCLLCSGVALDLDAGLLMDLTLELDLLRAFVPGVCGRWIWAVEDLVIFSEFFQDLGAAGVVGLNFCCARWFISGA